MDGNKTLADLHPGLFEDIGFIGWRHPLVLLDVRRPRIHKERNEGTANQNEDIEDVRKQLQQEKTSAQLIENTLKVQLEKLQEEKRYICKFF